MGVLIDHCVSEIERRSREGNYNPEPDEAIEALRRRLSVMIKDAAESYAALLAGLDLSDLGDETFEAVLSEMATGDNEGMDMLMEVVVHDIIPKSVADMLGEFNAATPLPPDDSGVEAAMRRFQDWKERSTEDNSDT